jgi:hypothetical protein
MKVMQYGLAISMLANGVLLATVVGVLPFFLYLSTIIIIAMGWYVGVSLRELNQYNNDMVGLLNSFSDLQTHLNSIYEMEMFYGEPTLQDLINHIKDMSIEIDFYIQKYSLSEEEDIEEKVGTT